MPAGRTIKDLPRRSSTSRMAFTTDPERRRVEKRHRLEVDDDAILAGDARECVRKVGGGIRVELAGGGDDHDRGASIDLDAVHLDC